MGSTEETDTKLKLKGADFERFRLRSCIESLPAEELEMRREPIDLTDVLQALKGKTAPKFRFAEHAMVAGRRAHLRARSQEDYKWRLAL